MMIPAALLVTAGGVFLFRRLRYPRRRRPSVARLDEPHSDDLRRAEPGATEPRRERQGNATGATNLDRKLWVAMGSTAAAGIGDLVLPPLGLLSVPGILYVSTDLVSGTIKELKQRRRLSVDALVLLLMIACLKKGMFFACSLNMAFAMAARRLTDATRRESEADVLKVFEHQAEEVRVVRDGREQMIDFAEVERGDLVRIHAGEMIPIDGRVVSGSASVDQRVLTGEAQPVERGAGEPVLSMTMVFSGSILVRVERAGHDTVAAEIGRILEATMNQKTETQIWAEDLSNKTVVPTVIAGAALLPALGPYGAMALMQSHPKYKPILASHLALLTTFSALADRGVLIKDSRAIELLGDVDTVVFDKTGTLTLGALHVARIHLEPGCDETTLLRWTASLEAHQSHPIAAAILAEAERRQLPLSPLDDASVVVGFGLKGSVEGKALAVGSARFMANESVEVSSRIERHEARCAAEGHSLVMISCDGQCVGALELHATVRPEAAEVVRVLRETLDMRVVIISGDMDEPTRQLAGTLAVDDYFAETLPEDKAKIIADLQSQGRKVCFIGDGINDAVALATAEVSISLEGASSVARDSAMIVLLDDSLTHIAHLLSRARYERRRVRTAFGLVLGPHLYGLGGAMALGVGYLDAILLNQLGLALGVGYVWATRKTRAQDELEALANQALTNQALANRPLANPASDHVIIDVSPVPA